MPSILIVDADDLSTDFLAEHLNMLGYRAHRVDSGERALALLGAGDRPEALILGLNPHSTDAFTTAQRIRERFHYDPIIIGLAAQDAELDIAAGVAAGFDAWLSRPINTTQLASTLERWLNEH